jgi:hypothetical protein
MDAELMTFGVEIECNLPAAVMNERGIYPGAYHRGDQIPGLPEGWNGQSDGSVRASRGRRAIEVVSPVLRGSAGLKQVREVIETLKAWGARVNESCGFHVHVGWELPKPELKKLVSLVANLQAGIYAATGTKNREDGSYCAPIREPYRRIDWTRPVISLGRYHLLNLKNVLDGHRPTVEFRAFGGTLNFQKVAAYIRLCLGLVQRACTSKAPAKYDPPHVNRERKLYRGKGDGQCEMIRLLYGLGWIKGDQQTQWGALTDLGLPSIERSVKALLGMAAKYDGPITPTTPQTPATPA